MLFPFKQRTENSVIFMTSEELFVLRFPLLSEKSKAMYKPLQWKIWLAIGITLLANPLIIYAVSKFSGSTGYTYNYSIQDTFWFMVRTLLRQDTNPVFQNRYIRMLLFIWNVGSFIITAGYCGLILSSLSFPGFQPIPKSEAELYNAVQDGTYSLITYNTSNLSVISQMQTMNYENASDRLYESFLKYMRYMTISIKEGLQEVLKGEIALSGGQMELEPIIKALGEEKFWIIKRTTNDENVFFIIRDFFPQKKEFLQIINRILENGFHLKFYHEVMELIRRQHEFYVTESSKEAHAINLVDLQPSFSLLFVGHLLAVIALIFEVIFSYLFCC